MKKLTFYGIISTISIIIRQFVLPNPFEFLGVIPAILINGGIEPIIHFIAFGVVGFFYESGQAPALGSLAYLGVYAGIVGILCLLASLSVVWWVILVVLISIAILVKIAKWIIEEILW